MLSRLTVRDFAIVDRLEVEWAEGFNVITGETGAGKSIIVDAVGVLLGDRVGPELVRTGADRALVEGVFILPPEPSTDLQGVLDEFGLEPEEGMLIVSREVAAPGGRGGSRVNGRTVPLTVLQQLGEQLVDIHGQSQHMALMRTREHVELLDRFGGHHAERSAVREAVRALRATREELANLQAEERQAVREQDILRHEVEEIERADPREGEEEALQGLRNRLRHVERLRQAISEACAALNGAEGAELEQPGALDLLGRAMSASDEAAQIDAALQPRVETLNAVLASADEVNRELRSYLETIEADPAELERAEERIHALVALKRKYGETVAEVLAYLADARGRLDRYERRDERRADLLGQEAAQVVALVREAQALSVRRREAAEHLARAVEGELADLRMDGTRFAVSLVQQDDREGVPLDQSGRTVAFDTTGVDRVEFLISPNPGEEPRPLARVASGGELARIALALKSILARADTRATLIFDEVDVGVGGRTAPVVGQKLWGLANAGHQVLCVTHMPQVAAFADQHWVVAKQAADGRTRTAITPLRQATRVEELAAMLAGSASSSARGSALELIERAASFKAGATGGTSATGVPAVNGVDPEPTTLFDLPGAAAPKPRTSGRRTGPK